LLGTQLLATVLATTLALITWSGHASVTLVIACALGLGLTSAFSAPAGQALLGDLVPRHELQSAVALNSMTYNLARAIGPALAGLSVAKLGYAPSFAINGASYLALVVGLLVVVPRPRELAARGQARLRESIRLAIDDRRLLAFLLIVAAVGFASDPVNTESPAFAHAFGFSDDRLRLWSGIIVGVFGAGAITAALTLAGRVRGSQRRMMITLSVLAGGIICFSVAPTIWVAFPFLAVAGFGYLASNVSATSGLILEADEAQRGRIMALWSVAFLGLRPLASLADGAIAGTLGVRAAGVALALPALAGAAAIYFLRRHHTAFTQAA
jgi:MFS family permease